MVGVSASPGTKSATRRWLGWAIWEPLCVVTPSAFGDVVWNAEQSFRNTAGNRANRFAVPADGNGPYIRQIALGE